MIWCGRGVGDIEFDNDVEVYFDLMSLWSVVVGSLVLDGIAFDNDASLVFYVIVFGFGLVFRGVVSHNVLPQLLHTTSSA